MGYAAKPAINVWTESFCFWSDVQTIWRGGNDTQCSWYATNGTPRSRIHGHATSTTTPSWSWISTWITVCQSPGLHTNERSRPGTVGRLRTDTPTHAYTAAFQCCANH